MRTGREMLLLSEAEQGRQTQTSKKNYYYAQQGRQEQVQEDQEQTAGGVADCFEALSSPAAAAAAAAAASTGGLVRSSVGVSVGRGGATTGDGGGEIVIPIAPHRRLRQAVLLAQKLLRREGELEVARKELAEVQQR